MPAAISTRLALIEARRGGLVWLAGLSIVTAVALGGFLAQLAITESRLLQAAVVAALLRVCAVFAIASQVVASVRREIDDKRLELLLALPLSRAAQYLGRLAGFIALGFVLALTFAVPLTLWAPPAAVAGWALSLACELALVAAAALFFAMTLAQLVPALAATAGLYFLARSCRGAGRANRLAFAADPRDNGRPRSAARAGRAGVAARELRRARGTGASRNAAPAGVRLRRPRLRPADRLARGDPRTRSEERISAVCRSARVRGEPGPAAGPHGTRVRLPAGLHRSRSALAVARARRASRPAPGGSRAAWAP